MRNKVIFGLIFLITAAVAVLSGSDYSRFLWGFEFLLAVALFACGRISLRQVDAVLLPPVPEGNRGEDLCFEVQLENQGRLPVSEIRVEMKCRDEFDGRIFPICGTAMLDSGDLTVLRFTLRARHYGVLTVWGEGFRVGDPLGVFFPGQKFPAQQWQVAVLPPWRLSGREQIPDARGTAEDGAFFAGQGNDLSAAYELRKYQDGEPLRNIHWKMTAKTDEFMVKEFARETDNVPEVYLNLDTEGKDYDRENWDAFLETVASFAAWAVAMGRGVTLCWQDGHANLYRMAVRDEAGVREALAALSRMRPYSSAAKTGDKEIPYHETHKETVCIDLWGRIKQKEHSGTEYSADAL